MDRRSSGCAGPFFLGEADCPVAPLLAMTRGGGPCTRRHLPVFCMSLRTSAHTGAAIRVPAGIPDKLAAARANSYQLRICLRYYSLPCAAAGVTDCHVASLLAMTCNNLLRVRAARTHCRGKPVTAHEFAQSAAFSELSLRRSGLPRRFAPRNDKGGRPLHPQTPARLLHVIANQCAHWCGNPFSPQRNLASWHYFWQIRSTFPYSPKVLPSVMPCRRECGLPRRFAPRNDMQKHAAVCGCNCVVPGKFVTFSYSP